jgi:glycosyltransferase involved in cell wall biosynthesis
MLIVLMSVFNEARNIAKAIESVHDVADEIHIFDGAFMEYPHDKPYSTDGTSQIAKRYPKVIFHECKETWNSLIEKRSKMFEVGKPGDYFFILDGDEYVTNPEEIANVIKNDFQVGWAWTISNIYQKPYMSVRLLKHQPGLHYAGRHYWIYNCKQVFVTSHQNMNSRFTNRDTSIRVFNFRDSSSVNRINDKNQLLKNRRFETEIKVETQVYNKFTNLIPHLNRAGKPSRLTNVVREIYDPEYTFTLMFSRPWAMKRYFRMLDELRLPENIEAVVVIDSNSESMRKFITYKFSSDKRFGGVKIIFTGNSRLPEFTNANHRRQRIIDNWHYILSETRGKIILASEDDSLPCKDAYMKLLKSLTGRQVDFVQGNIIGRWRANICPAWQIEEQDGVPVKVWNMKEKQEGVDEVMGVGWYCFVAPADVVRKYPMYLDDQLPLGPDVRFGYELYKHGFKLLHRWDVRVEHFGEDFSLLPGRDGTKQRIWTKVGDKWLVEDGNIN